MADDGQDPFAFIADDCGYSTSQEELLSLAKFGRGGGTLHDEEKSQARQRMHRKLDGEDDFGAIIGPREAELAGEDANRAGTENLGFGVERKGGKEGEAEASGTKLEGSCGGEREVEPQLKCKVNLLVHCSGKMVIAGEEVVASSADLKVEEVSTLRSVVLESAGHTEKLSCEGEGEDFGVEGEMGTESGVKRKLEFVLDTEVINFGDEEWNSEKGRVGKEGGDRGERSGKVEDGDEKKEDVMTARGEEEVVTKPRKRELPRSMFELGWEEETGDAIDNGVGVVNLKEASVEGKIDECDEEDTVCTTGSGDANGDRVVGNGNAESGVKEASVKDGSFKAGEEGSIWSILDVLKVIAGENCSLDDGGIDVFETAKRSGITFPRSRFLL